VQAISSSYNLNLPTVNTVQSFAFKLNLRCTNQTVYGPWGNSWYTFQTAYGVVLPITEKWEVGAASADFHDESDFSTKYQLSDSLAASATLFTVTDTNISQRVAGLAAQLILSKSFFSKQLSLDLVPSYVPGTFATGINAIYNLDESFRLVLECIPVLSGFRLAHPTVSAGIKWNFKEDSFDILISNSTGLTPNSILPGTDNSDWHLGFNFSKSFESIYSAIPSR